jgi:WD40 repeat protein
MADTDNTNGPAPRRYSAFVCYSHKDRRWARWLHRSLETYSLRKTGRGGPDSLRPVYRDDDENRGGPDLSAAIKGALANSRTMIVICSPNAARSTWVEDEIKEFKSLGKGSAIIPVIVAGTPNGEKDNCFPQALLLRSEADGRAQSNALNPLGIDLRVHGRHDTLLKVIAAMLDVSFDDLKQRDRLRRIRRTIATTALAATVLLAVAALELIAFLQNENGRTQLLISEAERQRESSPELATLLSLAATPPPGSLIAVGRADASTSLWRSVAARPDVGFARLGRDIESLVWSGSRQRILVRFVDGDIAVVNPADLSVRAAPLPKEQGALTNERRNLVVNGGSPPPTTENDYSSDFLSGTLAVLSDHRDPRAVVDLLQPNLRHELPPAVEALSAASNEPIVAYGANDNGARRMYVQRLGTAKPACKIEATASSFDRSVLSSRGEIALFLHSDGSAVTTVDRSCTPRSITADGDDKFVDLRVSANGRVTALYTSKGKIAVVDLVERKAIAVLSADTPLSRNFGVSPDGGVVFSSFESKDGTRHLFYGLREKATLFQGSITRYEASPIAVSPMGHLAAIGAIDGTVWLVNLKTRNGRLLKGHTQKVQYVTFDDDGARLFSGALDQTARVWDVNPRPPYATTVTALSPLSRETRTVIAPLGGLLLFGADSGGLAVQEMGKPDLTKAVAHWKATLSKHPTTRIHAFATDGTLAVQDAPSKPLRLVSPHGGLVRTLPTLVRGLTDVAFTPDDHHILLRFDSGEIAKVATASGKRIWSVKGTKAETARLRISHDQKLMIAVPQGGAILPCDVIDLERGVILRQLQIKRESFISMMREGQEPESMVDAGFSSDGSVVLATLGGAVWTWDREHWRGREIRPETFMARTYIDAENLRSYVNRVLVSPRGSYVVFGNLHGELLLGRVGSTDFTSLGGGEAYITTARWTSDERFVVAGYADGRVIAWDSAAGLPAVEVQMDRSIADISTAAGGAAILATDQTGGRRYVDLNPAGIDLFTAVCRWNHKRRQSFSDEEMRRYAGLLTERDRNPCQRRGLLGSLVAGDFTAIAPALAFPQTLPERHSGAMPRTRSALGSNTIDLHSSDNRGTVDGR